MANLASASRLTDTWGPLDENTSRHVNVSDDGPTHFVMDELGDPLADDTGFFVYTAPEGGGGDFWYAITRVDTETEVNEIYAAYGPVAESVEAPVPVLVRSVNGGKGRLYTQFRDYENWNPTLGGYAYNFAVALPPNYDSAVSYPLQLQLHAYGETHKFEASTEFDIPQIQLFPQDPRDTSRGNAYSWWYGFSDTFDYRNPVGAPVAGNIVNYTEERVLDAAKFLIDDPDFSIDTNRVYAYGHSMGASGSLSLGIRYGNLLTGIYGSQPMTNFASSDVFEDELERLWGDPSLNLPTLHRGNYADPIQAYGVGGSLATGVWDWVNHQEQLVERRGDDMAFLITDFGKLDTVIEWAMQGQPIWRAYTDGNAGFAGVNLENTQHSWMSFAGVLTNLSTLFGMESGDNGPWRYPLNMSYLSITKASDSSSVSPADTGDDAFNQNIVWSTPWLNFDAPILDTIDRYEVSIRSNSVDQIADVTPRRAINFTPVSGAVCDWQAVSLTDGNVITPAGTNLIVDIAGLATAVDVPINAGAGVRLSIDCS